MQGITLQNVTLERDDKLLFDHLNQEIKGNQLVLLSGDSGSGKSTLMRMIAGFVSSDYEGQILVNGDLQLHRSMSDRARNVGMVFQNPDQQFTMKTVEKELIFALENIALDPSEIDRRIQEIVNVMGLDLLLHREINTLSGGEKQKCAIAVILAIGAPIILLDEPFSSIDPASRQDLMVLLGKLRDEGKQILISDHDFSGYQEIVDQVLVLSGGRLTETNIKELLLKDKTPRLYQAGFESPVLFGFRDCSITRGEKTLLAISDFSLKEGITTLTGDNGSGKSTLLKAMVQRQKYRGKMLYHDRKLKKSVRLFSQMSLGVQASERQFVTMTPQEEITYNIDLSDDLKAKQQEAFHYLGIRNKLEKSIYHLSEGQKKMVQLIAMLSLPLDFLLLDEPFSGLDERACSYFVDWIKEKSLVAKQSFLIVTHRLDPLDGISHYHVKLENQSLSYNSVGEGER